MNNKVLVLLSTFNGEKYLEEQLNSLIDQRKVIVQILVRDDGSTDGTLDILNKWKNKGLLEYYVGENMGPAHSFLDLLHKAPYADYYAFCDQDDVWMSDKLQVAVESLKDHVEEPALYVSKTTLVDAQLNPLNYIENNYNYTFGESYLRNPCIGCTMVFNEKMKDLACLYNPSYISMHDGWIYKLCLAMHGFLYADKNSYIKYRQHMNNVVGGESSLFKTWKRRWEFFFKRSSGSRFLTNKELYKGYYNLFPEDTKVLVRICLNYKQSLKNKIRFIFNKSIDTPKKRTRLYFALLVLLNKY